MVSRDTTEPALLVALAVVAFFVTSAPNARDVVASGSLVAAGVLAPLVRDGWCPRAGRLKSISGTA